MLCGLWLVAWLTACAEPAASTQGSVPQSVRQALSRGVNVSGWFTHRADPALAAGWPRAADFAQMAALGLGHVRLLVDADWLSRDVAHAREVMAAIAQANGAGLPVVLALQPASPAKQAMARDEQALEAIKSLWRQLAQQLRDVPDDQLLFELLNEPEIEDVQRVHTIQHALLQAVRAISPGRVVVVNGAHYADVDDLVASEPLPEPGVVYAFHFYEPHNFTHQGATWGWPMWAALRGLPYPSSSEALQEVIPRLAEPAREHARWYGEQQWDRARLAHVIERVATWSRRHRVPVWCSEFGVLREVAPADSRERWLSDVQSLFAGHDIGWSYFDWWGHFGLVTGPPGDRRLDAVALRGLRLETAVRP